jgi:hypothetical protein
MRYNPRLYLLSLRASPDGLQCHTGGRAEIGKSQFISGKRCDIAPLGAPEEINKRRAIQGDWKGFIRLIDGIDSVISYRAAYHRLGFFRSGFAAIIFDQFGEIGARLKQEKYPLSVKMMMPFGFGPNGSALVPSARSAVTASSVHAPTIRFAMFSSAAADWENAKITIRHKHEIVALITN